MFCTTMLYGLGCVYAFFSYMWVHVCCPNGDVVCEQRVFDVMSVFRGKFLNMSLFIIRKSVGESTLPCIGKEVFEEVG